MRHLILYSFCAFLGLYMCFYTCCEKDKFAVNSEVQNPHQEYSDKLIFQRVVAGLISSHKCVSFSHGEKTNLPVVINDKNDSYMTKDNGSKVERK